MVKILDGASLCGYSSVSFNDFLFSFKISSVVCMMDVVMQNDEFGLL